MGVGVVWLLYPQTRVAYVCAGGEMTEQVEGVLRVEGTAIEVEVRDIFSTLDA